MMLRLDPSLSIPPFEQLRAQLALQVASGQLRPGARLPTIRALASQLGLAPGTVARAYRELEVAGIVEGHGRRGTFVAAEPPNAFSVVERRARLDAAADHYALTVRQLGVDAATAAAAVESALAR